MAMRRWAIAAVALAQLVVLAWGSGLLASMNDVEVRVFQFKPGRVEVKVGSSVTWLNQDDISHTVTSGTPGSPTSAFDATLAGQGARTTVTFAERGVYPYFCSRHQAMRGEVSVQ
jgi:plastocyanin